MKGAADQEDFVILIDRPRYLMVVLGFGGMAISIAFGVMTFAEGIPAVLHFPLHIFLVWMGLRSLLDGVAALWRIVDRSPLLIIDADGATFHPSLHRGSVPWSAMKASRMRRYNHGGTDAGVSVQELQIDLNYCYWSINAFWPRRRVRLPDFHGCRATSLQKAARLIRKKRLSAGWSR